MQSARHYIWGFIGKIIPQAINQLTTIVLAQFLTPVDFGTIGVLSVFFMIASTLVESGLSGSLINKKNISELDCSTIFVFNFVVSHTLYIILFCCAGYIEEYFAIENLAFITRLISLVFVINSWGIVCRTLIIRELRFKELSVIQTVGALSGAMVAIIMAICDCGVYSLVALQITQAIVTVVACYYRKPYKINFKFGLENFKQLMSFGIMTTIIGVVDTIYENAIAFIFGKYLNVSHAGYVSQAKKIQEASSQSIIISVSSVAFPILSRLSTDKQIFIKEADSLFKLLCYLLIPLLMSISLFAKEIILLLFGDKWIDASEYLTLLTFAGILIMMDSLYRTFVKSYGHVKELLAVTLIKRTVGIVLIVITTMLNVEWLLYAYIIGALVGLVLSMGNYCRILGEGFDCHLRRVFIILLPNVLYFAVCAIFRKLITVDIYVNIGLAIALLTFYYFLYLRIVEINLLDKLKKVFNRLQNR